MYWKEGVLRGETGRREKRGRGVKNFRSFHLLGYVYHSALIVQAQSAAIKLPFPTEDSRQTMSDVL